MQSMTKAHEAADIFPMMTNRELQVLADDIKENGLQQPIVLTCGMILDGRNRAAACALAEIEPTTTEWSGELGTEIEFVLSRNIHRRHMSESQRALAAALAAPMMKSLALEGKKVANLPRALCGRTAAKLGARFNVSERLVRHAMKITDFVRLCEAVQNGQCKVSVASTMTAMTDAEQLKALAKRLKPKVKTQVQTAENAPTPLVKSFEVELNAEDFDMELARPNLAPDATVVITAGSSQIGAAVALLSKWRVPITSVRSAVGEYQPGPIRVYGGTLPYGVTQGEDDTNTGF
jgi:ParB-like chromosome segregation protein Spo0J